MFNAFPNRRRRAVPDPGYIAWLERQKTGRADPDDRPDPRDLAAIENVNDGIAEAMARFCDIEWMLLTL